MKVTELWINRGQLRDTKIVAIDASALQDGEVRLAIDKFALTANNISYAVTGDTIGYWQFFPADEGWGKIPVWGFATVLESHCPELSVGERIWGYFPMASHLVVRPGKVTTANFLDFSPHRKALPAVYNQYHRTGGDPAPLRAMEDERCLLFPLFATSFVIYDYLIDNSFFAAEQVVIASASSKTAFGLAHLLHNDAKISQRVIGLTSPGNIDFVKRLGIYDDVVSYAEIPSLNRSVATDFVDMSGDAKLVTAIHEHFTDQLKDSCLVGATHWESDRKNENLPGPKPNFFFAPTRFAKRDGDWGPGATIAKAFAAAAQISFSIKGTLAIEHRRGPDAVRASYLALINNEIPPSVGLMLSLA